MVTVRQVRKHLPAYMDLIKGEGYWYFVIDTLDNESGKKVWETESVYTVYLNSLSLEEWASIGQSFYNRVMGE